MSDQLLGDGEEKKKRVTLNIDTKMLKIGFIGGGKMAQALARGFIRSGKDDYLIIYSKLLLFFFFFFFSLLNIDTEIIM